MAVFSAIIRVHVFRLSAGLFSCCLLRGLQGGGVGRTVQALAPAGLCGPFSRWSKSRDPASNSGDGVPLPKSHPGAQTPTRLFVFSAAKKHFFLAFLEFAATATTAHSPARVPNGNNKRTSAARVECCSGAAGCCC